MPTITHGRAQTTNRLGGLAAWRLGGNFIQWILGLLLIWAAIYKSWSPGDSLRLSGAVLPSASPAVVVSSAAIVEWTVGVLLLLGILKRPVLGLFIVMMACFSAVLFRAKMNGFAGSCGCLGLGGTAGSALVRNGFLIALAMVSFFAPSSGAVILSKE